MAAHPDSTATRHRSPNLSPERQAMVEQLVARATAHRADPMPVLAPRPDPDQPAPLSFAQERLWYMEQLFQRRDIFAFPAATRLRGHLDPGALVRGLRAVVCRHDALRTTFQIGQSGTVQQVVERGEPQLDVEVVSAGGGVQECLDAATADVRRGFDLTAAPPLRTRLYRLGPDDHVLVVNQHVAVADVPSRINLLRELWQQYAHLTGGPPPALPPLPIQYADFAVWQRQLLQGERLHRLVRYWRERLDGVPHKLALPTDRPRPPRHAGSGRFWYSVAPAGLAGLVSAAARRLRTTPSVLLLALYRALLWHQCGQEDFVIGAPKGERAHPETEHVIGYFVNVLPLRTAVRPAESVRELVAREHAGALGAYAHQELPYEWVVQSLNPVREPGVPPLYQVSYSYVPAGVQDPPLAPPGLRGEAFPVSSEGTEYDLGINLTHDRHQLRSQWPYNTEILDEDTVAGLAGQFWTLVGAALDDVDGLVSALPVAPLRAAGAPPPPAAAPEPVAGPAAEPVAGPVAGPAGSTGAQDSPVERAVAEVWGDLLAVSTPAADANFFDLGGHSLKLADLSARLSARFQLDRPVPVVELLERPTIAEQARLLAELTARPGAGGGS